jgi:O-antigen/teichoic acid export membrane protein
MALSSRRATTPYRAFVELGSRLSRDTLLYSLGTTLTLPVGLILTAFLTRHFNVSQFGELAVLFAFSSLLTIALNMVFLQGPLLLVFLHSEDSTELTPDEAEAVAQHERPIMLTTGLFVTATIGIVVAVGVAIWSEPLAQLLIGSRSASTAVTLAGISAASGAIWRYVTNVTRFEKRAWSFATWAAARPVVALLVTVPLILAGEGIASALVGAAAGSLLSAGGALWISRRSYALAIDRSCARRAARAGVPWVPVVLGLYFAHSADLLLLRATSTNAQLGFYRVADSLSQVISYAVSAFHLAQVPLDATLMSQAAYDRHSRDRVMASYVLAYLIGAVFLTLFLVTVGGVVISVIAPGYGRSVPFVPLTSLAYVAYGFLLTVFRAGDFFERRTRAYGWTAGSAGALVIVLALLGGRLIGVAGVPIGATLGCMIPSAVLLALGAIKRHPLPLDYRRLLGTLALGAACWAPGAIVGGHGAAGVVAKLVGIACFPAGLILFGIIPRPLLGDLRSMIGGLLPGRRDSTALLVRVYDLPASQRGALLAILRDHLSSTTAALRLGVDELGLRCSVVAGLRRLAGGSGEFPLDENLGYYLISGDAPADLDSAMREFRRAGANMIEFRVMENIYHRLKKVRRRAWNHAATIRHRPSRLENGALVAGERLRALAGSGWSVTEAARREQRSPVQFRAETLAELRRLAGCPARGPQDQLIAGFLLEPESRSPTDQLWAAGVDPIELHQLELALVAVRNRAGRSRRKRVRAAVPTAEQVALR